jgi:hypothetical protein
MIGRLVMYAAEGAAAGWILWRAGTLIGDAARVWWGR